MKNKNFKVNKSLMNFIHVRDFWSKDEDAERLNKVISHLIHFQPKRHGIELEQFNLYNPEIDMILGGMLGDWVKIKDEESGFFRVPYSNVMFEDFDSLNEWRLAIALEDNVFKMYNHISGAKDAKEGYEFDYMNPDDWVVESQINLKHNDAVFYRPWVFHSFESKLLQCFKLYVEE